MNGYLAGAVGLVTGILGGIAGALLVVQPLQFTTDPSPPDQSGEAGAAALAQIATDVRALRETVDVQGRLSPEPAAATREPAAGPTIDRLERAISELAQVLEERPALARATGSGSGPQPIESRPRSEGLLRALRAADPAKRARPYYFWSYEAIVERFGSPDTVYVEKNQTVRLHYRFSEEDWMEFRFVGGTLVEVQSN